jgi:hypothetical protein
MQIPGSARFGVFRRSEGSSISEGSSGRLPAEFAAQAFACRSLFGPFLLARFQIEGMLLNFLDDVFLLDLPFEALQSALQRLTILNYHFSQSVSPP